MPGEHEQEQTLERLVEEQRQMTDRLHASEELLHLMVDSINDCAIFMLDPEGRVITWNAPAERIFGYQAEQIIGQPTSILYPSDDAANVPAKLREAATNGQHREETWRIREDGTRFWAEAVTNALYDQGHHLRGFVKLTRDMTVRRQAEQALRDSEAQLRGVITCAVDGIIAITERGLIEWLNPAALAIFGYSAEELLGKNINVLMPEPYHSQHDAYVDNYLRTGQRKIIGIGREVAGKRKDGSIFPLDLAVSEVKLGDRRMFTGIVRDITIRKEAERALLAAKEAAETASKAKDHLLAVVSHELRTPLTPILATASLLQDRTDVRDDVKEELATIRRNAEHEARLVDDLLSLTRLSRGKIELHHEVVDAHATLRNVLTHFQAEIDSKNIELSMALRAKSSYIWADPGRIRQVFANLLSNAVKFTPTDGHITIRSLNAFGDKLHIEFIDNGIGIETDVLPRIFSPFEQGEKTVTRKYGGLGLGLAIAKGIMDLHHGTLTAASKGQGQGASFVFELETVPAVPERNDAPAARARAIGVKKRILLVEDHPDTLRIIAKLLRWLGYEVTTAASVKETMELAAGQQFDLLISDIGLPDGSGLDIMRSLKGRPGMKGVALTGFGEEDDQRRSREAGFAEHLVKPVSFEMLESVIQQLA